MCVVQYMCVGTCVLYMFEYFRGNLGSVAGYTVSSVTVGDGRRLYVAGAPRFKHKGKVILFDLSQVGDVNITQAIEGEQVEIYHSSLLYSFIFSLTESFPLRNNCFHLCCSFYSDWLLFWQWGVCGGCRSGWYNRYPPDCCPHVPGSRKQRDRQSLCLLSRWGKKQKGKKRAFFKFLPLLLFTFQNSTLFKVIKFPP